jgi:hypothetical protein
VPTTTYQYKLAGQIQQVMAPDGKVSAGRVGDTILKDDDARTFAKQWSFR